MNWWPAPCEHVLASEDLFRPIHGTWLGITKQGRIAALTNFYQEEGCVRGSVSRGAIATGYLSLPPEDKVNTRDFVELLFAGDGPKAAGGFNLLCGCVGEPLCVVSNRNMHPGEAAWLSKGEIEAVALSNTAYGDRSWRKVKDGEQLLKETIHESLAQNDAEADLIERLLQCASVDTLPTWREAGAMTSSIYRLRESLFIPAVTLSHDAPDAPPMHVKDDHSSQILEQNPALSGIYGTKEQSVILVDNKGRVKYVERTLFDENGERIPENERDRIFEFQIEGLNGTESS